MIKASRIEYHLNYFYLEIKLVTSKILCNLTIYIDILFKREDKVFIWILLIEYNILQVNLTGASKHAYETILGQRYDLGPTWAIS